MVFRKLENKFTFHPERAVVEDLTDLKQQTKILKSEHYDIAIRYKLTASPHFILLSHGNSSCVDSIRFIYQFYDLLGVSYLAYDYPGYGKSSGRPSEKGCYESFETAYEFVTKELNISTANLVLHGASLGGAVTIHGALGKPIEKIVLLATFTSPADLASRIVPFLPGAKYISRQFKSIKKIGKLTGEILFIHGAEDPTVPLSHSKELYKASKQPCFLYEIPNCGHKDHIQAGGKKFEEVWRKFLAGGVKALSN